MANDTSLRPLIGVIISNQKVNGYHMANDTSLRPLIGVIISNRKE